MKDERVLVLIDGSNLYYRLKQLSLPRYKVTEFNYRKFANWLARSKKLTHCNYYVGVVRAKPTDKKAQKLRRAQQRLFAHLESKNQSISVIRGYLMESSGIFHEKGVDVQMAVDLVVGAGENKYDRAILVSSDNDLIPAIRYARQRNKHIEYIGFSHQPSYGLIKNATETRLLIADDLAQFIEPKNSQ